MALRDLGRSPEYLVAADEGHGFANAINLVAACAGFDPHPFPPIWNAPAAGIYVRDQLRRIGVDARLRPDPQARQRLKPGEHEAIIDVQAMDRDPTSLAVTRNASHG